LFLGLTVVSIAILGAIQMICDWIATAVDLQFAAPSLLIMKCVELIGMVVTLLGSWTSRFFWKRFALGQSSRPR